MGLWQRSKRFFWNAFMSGPGPDSWSRSIGLRRAIVFPNNPELRQLAVGMECVLLLLVGVLFWSALGGVPGWLLQPVILFWWIVVGVKFLFLGSPFLWVPIVLLWEAVGPKKTKAEEETTPPVDVKSEQDWGIAVPLRTARQVLLFLGLLAAGLYPLAALYVFPDLAWFLLEQFHRIRCARTPPA